MIADSIKISFFSPKANKRYSINELLLAIERGKEGECLQQLLPLVQPAFHPHSQDRGVTNIFTFPTFLPISIPAEVTNSIILHEDRIGEHLLLLGVIVGHSITLMMSLKDMALPWLWTSRKATAPGHPSSPSHSRYPLH